MTAEALEDWLIAKVAAELGVPAGAVEPDAAFAELGLDSMQAVGITGEAEALLGRRIDPTTVFEFPTIRALAAHLAGAP